MLHTQNFKKKLSKTILQTRIQVKFEFTNEEKNSSTSHGDLWRKVVRWKISMQTTSSTNLMLNFTYRFDNYLTMKESYDVDKVLVDIY